MGGGASAGASAGRIAIRRPAMAVRPGACRGTPGSAGRRLLDPDPAVRLRPAMVHLVGSGGRATGASTGPRLLIDTEEAAPGVTKVNLRGRLDANGVQAISATFDRVARTQPHLIVDLSRVTFIASTGLRTLISAARAVASRKGHMVFLGPEASAGPVFSTT